MKSPRGLILAALFAALTAIGAYIRVPFPIVPFTLQVFFVLLSGAILGPRRGCASQLLYLAMGLLGLPVFSGGGGVQYVLHPTFGFILGFPVASWVVGTISRIGRGENFWQYLAASLAGIAAIDAIGILVLYLNLNYLAGVPTSFWRAMQVGLFPFLAFDAAKGVAVAIVALKVKEHYLFS
jgi:biotin transport system substrate-specific component